MGRRPKHEDLIDMTAMVDIVFFLLIFFLVTSMQSIEAVISIARAGAAGERAGQRASRARFYQRIRITSWSRSTPTMRCGSTVKKTKW